MCALNRIQVVCMFACMRQRICIRWITECLCACMLLFSNVRASAAQGQYTSSWRRTMRMIMTCLARFATDDDHLQKGTSLSVPLKLMPRCAYRDLRCFFSDIDHDAFRVCLSGLSASSGFSVVCLAVGIRRHWYFHCLGRFLLWYVILGIRCFFLVCSRRAHGTGMVGRFGCT